MSALNRLPPLAVQNSLNRLSRDFMNFRDRQAGHPAFQGSDVEHTRSSQFSATMPFTFRVAPLGLHVVDVIGVRPKKKMARVDAFSLVAPMQNAMVGRDASKVDREGDPMRFHVSSGGTRGPKLSISILIHGTKPEPAIVIFFDRNAFPKARLLRLSEVDRVERRGYGVFNILHDDFMLSCESRCVAEHIAAARFLYWQSATPSISRTREAITEAAA